MPASRNPSGRATTAAGRAMMGATPFPIRNRLRQLSTRRVALPALLGMLLCFAGLWWRRERLGGLELLDARQWYTPEQAAALFEALDRLDPHARAVYAWTELSLDMVFPLAYGLFFAILLLRAFGDGAPLYLLPLALASTDALENVSIAALAWSYDGAPSPLAWAAAAFTSAKSVLIVATLGAAGAGAVRWLSACRRRR